MKERMTDEISTSSHMSVAMTTIEQTQATGNTGMSSSSVIGDDFYWALAVLFMGVVGTAGNALILYALMASKQHKKHALIVNQNALDLFGSFFVVVSFVVKFCNVPLTRLSGYWLCRVILNDNLAYWGNYGSLVNLAFVTIHRYLKVVHHTWSRKYLRPWVVYSAMAIAWLVEILYNAIVAALTTKVINGMCMSYNFDSHASNVALIIWHITFFYVLVLAICVFCYGRIFVAIRRQTRVMASHNASGSNAGQTQSKQIQTNVIKTMVFVSALYAITWLPMTVYVATIAYSRIFYNVTSFIAQIYICTNPFVYATKFDPVRQILRKMIPCKKKTVVQPTAE